MEQIALSIPGFDDVEIPRAGNVSILLPKWMAVHHLIAERCKAERAGHRSSTLLILAGQDGNATQQLDWALQRFERGAFGITVDGTPVRGLYEVLELTRWSKIAFVVTTTMEQVAA